MPSYDHRKSQNTPPLRHSKRMKKHLNLKSLRSRAQENRSLRNSKKVLLRQVSLLSKLKLSSEREKALKKRLRKKKKRS